MKNQYQLTENVKLLQKMVLKHQNKFLILQRSPQAVSRPGKWDLPGGNVMWPESNQDLKNHHLLELLREVTEETGLALEPDNFMAKIKQCSLSTYFEVKTQTYSIIVGYTLTLAPDFDTEKIKLSEEHTAYAWIDPSEITTTKYDFGFAGGQDGFITHMVHQAFS